MAIGITTPISLQNSFPGYVSTTLSYAPQIAKGAVVAAAVFSLRKTDPVKIALGFLPITAISLASLVYGVKHEQVRQLYYTLQVNRTASSVLWGTIGLSRLAHFPNQSFFGRLGTLACLFASLSALDDQVTQEMLQEVVQKLRQKSVAVVELFKIVLHIVLRIPNGRLPLLMDPENVAHEILVNISNLRFATFDILVEAERRAGPSDIGQNTALKVQNALHFFDSLPEELQAKYLDQLLDCFVGQTLPGSIQSALTVDFLQNGNYMREKIMRLEANPLFPLRQQLDQIEQTEKLDLAELSTIDSRLRAIAQDIGRCLPFSDGPQFKEMQKETRALIQRLDSLLTRAPRPRTGKIDLDNFVFDQLYTSLSAMMANQTEARKIKEKQLQELLCNYFEVPFGQLYGTMAESEFGTLQQLVDKGICTVEDIEDGTIFFQKMESYFETKKLHAPPKKGGLITPQRIVLATYLTLKFPKVLGKVCRIVSIDLLKNFAPYWKFCAVVGMPLRIYQHYTFPISQGNLVSGENSIQKTHLFINSLLRTAVSTYPFFVAASLGYRVPKLKTTSFLFAAALGFFN